MTQSVFKDWIFFNKVPSLYSALVKMVQGIANLSALEITPASGLFEKICVIKTSVESLKYSKIFSAFEPEPEAKMTKFFKRIELFTTNLALNQEPFGFYVSFN